MSKLGVAVVLVFLGLTAGALAGFAEPTLTSFAPTFFFAKVALLLVVGAGLLVRSRPLWAVVLALLLALAALSVPVAWHDVPGLAALGLSCLAAFLALRLGIARGWLALAGILALASAARIHIEIAHPHLLGWVTSGAAATVGLAVLAGLFILAHARRQAAWVATFIYAVVFGTLAVKTLPPGTQFDAIMAALIATTIVAAALVASGFTYLFLKAFESLESRLVHSYVTFLPLMGAPFYLVWRQLADLEAGAGVEHWTWIAFALALDVTLLAEALFLWLVRLTGRKFSEGHFVPMVAWKFLRSQRLVPTWRTKWIGALRQVLAPGAPGARLRTAAEVLAAVLLPVAGVLASPHLGLGGLAARLLEVGLLFLATAYCSVRALSAASRRLWYVLPAVGLAAWTLAEMWGAPGSASLSSRVLLGLAAAATIPPVLVLCQSATTGFLRLSAARGRLSRNLDLRFSPPVETRLKQGVGASAFASVVGVAIGVWALIVVLSVMSGFSDELKERIVRTKDHVMVKTAPGEAELDNPLALAGALAEIPGVSTASPYVEGEAMMSSSINISATVTVRGVDREADALAFLEPMLVAGSTEFFRHPEELVPFPDMIRHDLFQGFELLHQADPPSEDQMPPLQEMPPLLEMPLMPDPGADDAGDDEAETEFGLMPMPDLFGEEDKGLDKRQVLTFDPISGGLGKGVSRPVIIGQELARSLAVGVGSRINVISPDGDVGPMGVQPKARSFVVAAVFATGMYDYDLKLAYMYLPDAQKFFNLGNAIDHVDVRLADLAATAAVRSQMDGLVPATAEILTWKELNRNLFSALELERIVMFVVLAFIILIASFNIVASLVIIIRKRLAAIAILRTMGATLKHITGVFFLLGSAVGLFGTASGVIMGLSSCGIIRHLGITLPREYYIRHLPVNVDPWQVLQIGLAALVITALASLYPGRLAAKIVLVEGLKDER